MQIEICEHDKKIKINGSWLIQPRQQQTVEID